MKKILLNFFVSILMELMFKDRDNFNRMCILCFEFLMMTAALKCITGFYEISHLAIELIASPSFFRFHDLLVKVDKGNILHMFLVTPLTSTFAWYVLSAALLLVLVSAGYVLRRVLQQWHTFTHFLYFYKPSRFLSISP
jgi:hypothetical protein